MKFNNNYCYYKIGFLECALTKELLLTAVCLSKKKKEISKN